MPSRKRKGRKCMPFRRRLSVNKGDLDTPKKTIPRKAMNYSVVSNGRVVQSPELKNVGESSSRLRLNVTEKPTNNIIDVSEILHVNWRVFRVSPLYNFSKNKLKIYRKRLEEELAAGESRSESAAYKCKFLFQELSLQENHDVIQILLTASDNKYIGFFLSSAQDQSKEKFPEIKHFPLLLVQGGGKILKQVHNIFCKFFDCDIHPVHFPYKTLTTFFSLVTNIYTKDVPNLSSEMVSLHYKIPGCPRSDSCSVALSLAATSTVFAVFNQEFSQTFSSNQLITFFYDWILDHILNVYRVDFSPAEIFKIAFPHFVISSEGWVKFSSEEVVKETLSIIGDIIKLDNIAKF